MNNNKASVKIGNTVFSRDTETFEWDNVTATYPYIGGTVQTTFQYLIGGEPDTDIAETGSYFIASPVGGWAGFYSPVYGFIKLNSGGIFAVPLLNNNSDTFYFNTYDKTQLFADAERSIELTEFPAEGDTFYCYVNEVHEITAVTPYSSITAGTTATDTPPEAPYDKPLIYNSTLDCIEKSLSNIEVVGRFKASSVTTPELHADEITTPSLTATEATIDDLTVTNPVENLTVENLTVTDTAAINHATIVTEEDIHSEADFIELRVGNPLPTPSTGSGFKVKNYDGNNNDLELVTDSSGTFRIGAGTVTETKTDQYAVLRNGDYYISDGNILRVATPTNLSFVSGTVVQPAASLELYSYNGNYYYKLGTTVWYDNLDTILVGTAGWTYGGSSRVTDTDLIAELEASATLETITDIVYSDATFTGSKDTNQPIATREEATQLNNNDLFAWDSTNNQLKHIKRPTINGTALKAIVTNGAVTGYDWGSSGGSGVSFIGTRAAYNTAKLIPEGQDGYISAGSLVIITDEDELLIGEDA